MNKEFNTSDHLRDDDRAKSRALEILLGLGLQAKKNLYVYNVDILIKSDVYVIGMVEVEVKRQWKGEQYPFPELRISARKIKFCVRDIPLFFVTFNDDLSAHALVSKENYMKAPLDVVSNRCAKEESFRLVPLDDVLWNGLYRLGINREEYGPDRFGIA